MGKIEMNSRLLFTIAGLIAIASLFGIYSFDYNANAQESPQVNLDKTTYSWTDKVHITVISPAHNLDENKIESIGDSERNLIQIYTGHTEDKKIQGYKLVETGSNTGVFTGEVTLTGFSHDADGNENSGIGGNDVLYLNATGVGPTDGFLPAVIDKGISVSFTFSKDETIVSSAPVKWNEGKTEWLASTYHFTGTGVVRVTDPDMNWNPETIDNFSIDVWSDSDAGGINLIMTETDKASGIFEGTVFFSHNDESSGHRLRITEGDTVYAEYEDNTLPSPNTIEDELDIMGTAMIDLPSDVATSAEDIDEKLLSPIKQMRNGVLPSNVVCDEALEKIYRPSGYAAVCVKPSTIDKLTERGWSIHVLK